MATDLTRTRVVEAAGPIFAAKGYRSATVREICDAADVGLASVNYHFRDKQRLYLRVVEQAYDYVREHRPPEPVHPPGTEPAERLRSWILRVTTHVMTLPQDAWQDRLFNRELLDPTPACEALLRTRLIDDIKPLMDILEEMTPPATPRHELWRIAFSVFGQCLFYDTHRRLVHLLVGDSPEYQAERVANHVTRMCLAFLGVEDPGADGHEEGKH